MEIIVTRGVSDAPASHTRVDTDEVAPAAAVWDLGIYLYLDADISMRSSRREDRLGLLRRHGVSSVALTVRWRDQFSDRPWSRSSCDIHSVQPCLDSSTDGAQCGGAVDVLITKVQPRFAVWIYRRQHGFYSPTSPQVCGVCTCSVARRISSRSAWRPTSSSPLHHWRPGFPSGRWRTWNSLPPRFTPSYSL
jgi:hypothetical protein